MSKGRLLAAVTLVAAVTVVATACGDSGPAGRLRVVATTTILGDVVANVVGDDAVVEVLIPLGADPHDYRASAQQVAALVEADLVVATGLSLEGGLEDVLAGAAADGGNVLSVGEGLDPIPLAGGGFDPHVWLDPLRMAEAARLIAAELESVAGDGDWQERAAALAAKLEEADAEIRAILAEVPDDRRLLVTNHDSLRYFALRYGFEVVGTVIPGGATLAAPSSADLADLVEVIDRNGVPAIFAETTDAGSLAEAVAAEAGSPVEVVELYSGSLGPPGSEADTLIGMLLADARKIAQALG